jgi:hypothetical protein
MVTRPCTQVPHYVWAFYFEENPSWHGPVHVRPSRVLQWTAVVKLSTTAVIFSVHLVAELPTSSSNPSVGPVPSFWGGHHQRGIQQEVLVRWVVSTSWGGPDPSFLMVAHRRLARLAVHTWSSQDHFLAVAQRHPVRSVGLSWADREQQTSGRPARPSRNGQDSVPAAVQLRPVRSTRLSWVDRDLSLWMAVHRRTVRPANFSRIG